MSPTTQTLTVPKELLKYWQPKQKAEQKVAEAAVLALVGEGTVTASRGAELLNMPLQDFIELMQRHGLTFWDDTPEELKHGLEDLRQVLNQNNDRHL